MTQEFYFDWYWDLQSSPQAIWPFASDTNRFNRDTGQPEIEMLDNVKGVKHVRMKIPLIQVEWEEEPFEWTYPYSFGVLRTYSKGPIAEMRVLTSFDPRPEGGTHVRYQTWMKTSNFFAQLAIPFAIGVIAKNRFEKAFRIYDRLANKRGSVIAIGGIEVPSYYRYACTFRPPHLRVTLTYLARRYCLSFEAAMVNGRYRRFCGDLLAPGKGEILVWVSA